MDYITKIRLKNESRLEPYAMKVARTVPRGGSFSNKITYLNRPYAALLLLIIYYNKQRISGFEKVIWQDINETPLFAYYIIKKIVVYPPAWEV